MHRNLQQFEALASRPQAPGRKRGSINHRRASSLPLDLVEKPSPPPYTGRRRASFTVHPSKGLQSVHENLANLEKALADMGRDIEASARRAAALDKAMQQTLKQYKESKTCIEARCAPRISPYVDVSEFKRQARETAEKARLANASVRKPTDNLAVVPFKDGRMPEHFPRRLAGFNNLSERQVDALLYAYGAEKSENSLDTKRRTLGALVGLDMQAIKMNADSHQLPRQPSRFPTSLTSASTYSPLIL